jgi:hypothetical protein
MNLFELNFRLAVKLGQSFETLYNLDYLEYSMLINIIKKDIEKQKNNGADLFQDTSIPPPSVGLPDNLRLG